MKFLLTASTLVTLICLTSCSGADAVKTQIDDIPGELYSSKEGSSRITPIRHFNVIIAPDLSNRLTKYKKPVTDNEIIDSVMESVYPRIANYKRKMNQLDKYRLDIINQQHIVGYSVDPKNFFIDLSRFKNQGDRIAYLAPFNPKSQFKQDKLKLKTEFARLTKTINANTAGSDIWTYLNEGLDSYKVDTTTSTTTFTKDIYKNEYKNVLLLFTDGYIESNNKHVVGKKSKNLSQAMIESFRNDFNKNNAGRDLATFLKSSGYGIIPLNNPMLKHLDILVLEMYDRSLSMGGATKSPTDMEIMKVFWEDWLKKSGVKNVDFLPISPTAAAAKDRIFNFMEIK